MSLEPAGPHSKFQVSLGYRLRFFISKQQENISHPSMGKVRHEKEVDLTLSHHAGEWGKFREVEIWFGFQHLLRVCTLNSGDKKTSKIRSRSAVSSIQKADQEHHQLLVMQHLDFIHIYSNRICSWFYCTKKHGSLDKWFSIPTEYDDYTTLQTHSISTPKVRPRQQQCVSLHGCFYVYASLRTLGWGSNRYMKMKCHPKERTC